MVRALRAAATAGRLPRVSRIDEIDGLLAELMASEWVVYAKPCLSHQHAVVRYLARYPHRIAISDERILAVDDRTVRFASRDHTRGAAQKTMMVEDSVPAGWRPRWRQERNGVRHGQIGRASCRERV